MCIKIVIPKRAESRILDLDHNFLIFYLGNKKFCNSSAYKKREFRNNQCHLRILLYEFQLVKNKLKTKLNCILLIPCSIFLNNDFILRLKNYTATTINDLLKNCRHKNDPDKVIFNFFS